MIYSFDEIELTLKMYPIAKNHLLELEQSFNLSNFQTDFSRNYYYYSYIVDKVNLWIDNLLPDEKEVIMRRIFLKQTFDYISIQLGYANHSSVDRKYKKIINKIRDLGGNDG
ncbi:hypothetical protein CWE04_08065 [Thomasclavelia cocleata]|uniref:Uncharacterized protein n=1 Tax=Thomasclavelia cocleata TaxID=69824 RepID=A0A1I0FJL1_9FIRM|nr:hypothetical protein [Thomasclavelia cocleata]MCR1961044.1 hypothetical protein [Thomasclavelia cocleata]NDO41190.1 hypothetical protein [Thomasclavelia cocleata]PJN80498.1 hypothetical protein CWE04_08065 [Thomasclavelia cocleata]SET58256.1 hypothetical protein SAMN04489758_1201 [Thomasclavelia cocleata]